MAGKLKTTPLTPGFSEQLPEPFNIPFDKLPQPTDDYETLRRDLFRCGYCLIKDAVSKPHLAALQQRLQEQAQAEDETGWSTRDGGAATDILKGGWDEKAQQPNQKVYCLVNKGKCFRDLVTMPLTSKLVGELLNPKWILSSLWANIACPGGEPMAMHCDQGGITLRYHTREAAMKNGDNLVGKTPKGYGGADAYASTLFKRWPKAPYGLKDLVKGFHKEPLPDILPPPLVCQVVYFLTDVTAENGGTCVVPGSHLSGILPPLDVEFTRVFPTANLSGPAGTACIFDGRLWHATGANVTTNEARPMIFQYCSCPQIRQQENLAVALKRDVYEQCDTDLRKRLGFQVWGPYNYTEKESRQKRVVGFEQATIGEMKPSAKSSRL